MFSRTKEGKKLLERCIVPNKLIAKIGSKFQKPEGLTVVRPEDVQEFLYPLDVSKIPGIGGKTTEALKLMGITKVEELANCDIQRFQKEEFIN